MQQTVSSMQEIAASQPYPGRAGAPVQKLSQDVMTQVLCYVIVQSSVEELRSIHLVMTELSPAQVRQQQPSRQEYRRRAVGVLAESHSLVGAHNHCCRYFLAPPGGPARDSDLPGLTDLVLPRVLERHVGDRGVTGPGIRPRAVRPRRACSLKNVPVLRIGPDRIEKFAGSVYGASRRALRWSPVCGWPRLLLAAGRSPQWWRPWG